jgi:16S rRNA pseudouridine516 synthase
MQNTIRIDKYLAQLNLVSRREAKKFFRSGRVILNGCVEYDHGFEVIDGDTIAIVSGETIFPPARKQKTIGEEFFEFTVRQSVTILLNKPAWYVCSEIDEWWHKSYKHLLEDCIYAPILKVAGRLDQDTTGLVLATSDGDLNHRLTSPKLSKEKEYIVSCEKEVSDADLSQLEQGVMLDSDYQTLPAKTVRIDLFSFRLIITEGKYHQVKRMCEVVDNICIALQRIRIAEWTIDGIDEWKRKEIIL